MTGGVPAEPQLTEAVAVTVAAPSRRHAHAWRGAFFFLHDDHPWFRMTCECGAERDIRAWERYSTPSPSARAAHPDGR